MLLLPSLMTEKSFWISEQRLFTSNWTKMFFFNEEKTEIYGMEVGVHCENLSARG
jgi:hypothetical protein